MTSDYVLGVLRENTHVWYNVVLGEGLCAGLFL